MDAKLPPSTRRWALRSAPSAHDTSYTYTDFQLGSLGFLYRQHLLVADPVTPGTILRPYDGWRLLEKHGRGVT